MSQAYMFKNSVDSVESMHTPFALRFYSIFECFTD